MTLYEIESELLALLENGFNAACIDEDGVVDEDRAAEYLEKLPIERDKKLEAYGLVIKNYEAEVQAIKQEQANLTARRQSKEKQVERLKKAITNSLVAFNQPKFETAKVAFSFRKTSSVEVDMDILDKEFIREKVEYSADKTAIKNAIKAGKVVEGAQIIEKQALQVK